MTTFPVFLDRDGTLNEEVGYLESLERLKLFPDWVAFSLLDTVPCILQDRQSCTS